MVKWELRKHVTKSSLSEERLSQVSTSWGVLSGCREVAFIGTIGFGERTTTFGPDLRSGSTLYRVIKLRRDGEVYGRDFRRDPSQETQLPLFPIL